MPELILTKEQMERFKKAMGDLVKKRKMQTEMSLLSQIAPDGPFNELIKMVAHYGQIPACNTCQHYNGFTCMTGEDWHEEKPTHFCAEWNPEQPGEKKDA